MFEEKDNIESDILMKAVLENAQEDVPERVWDGVAAGLDKAAQGKVVALWWRRAVAAGAAAAAAAVVLLLHHDTTPEQPLLPMTSEEGLIAVVEPERVATDEDMPEVLIAEVRRQTAPAAAPAEPETSVITQETPVATPGTIMETGQETVNETVSETVPNTVPETPVNTATEETATYFPEDWEEPEGDEDKKDKIRTSLVLSGIAGTNGTASQHGKSFIKRPTMAAGPVTTGIRESNTGSSYGVPLSAGVGVKLELSPKWSLGTGLSYSFLSRRFAGTYTKVSSEGLSDLTIPSDIRNTQHYIGIPVNVYYSILDNRNIDFYAYAGGAVEMCLEDRYEVLSASIIHKEDPKGVQLSAGIGIGVEFLLGKHAGLYIDPSLRYYFNNGQPKSIRTVQPLMLGLEMGVRFRL